MPRRGENIRKRKDGRWEARYKKGIAESGRVLYGSVYAKTYREVKEKQLQILREGEQQSAGKKVILFRDAANLWLDANRIRFKGATECRYQYLLQAHVLPAFGGKRLCQITGPAVNDYLAEKLSNGRLDGKGGLSAAYVRSIMLIISGVMAFAAAEGLCPPLRSQIRKPPIPPREVAVLSKTDSQRLEAELLHGTDSTKLGVLICLYTGLRVGEVCALTWEDIDLENRVLYVRHTVARVRQGDPGVSGLVIDTPKTPSSLRCVPICSRLQAVLKARQGAGYVVSDGADFISPRTFEYRYHRLLSAIGVPQIHFHALRHTFATRCIASGMDVKSLSEILGHSSVSTTLGTYVHSSMEMKRTQLERLAV